MEKIIKKAIKEGISFEKYLTAHERSKISLPMAKKSAAKKIFAKLRPEMKESQNNPQYNFSKRQLEIIAIFLNEAKMPTAPNQWRYFSSKTHYIDYHMKKGYGVFKKFKGYTDTVFHGCRCGH